MADEQPMTLEGVREEVGRAMNDPQHPQHDAYKRGLPAWTEWTGGLYGRIPGADRKVEVAAGGVTVGPKPDEGAGEKIVPPMRLGEAKAEGVSDGAFVAEVNTALRDRFGESYETEMAHVQAGWGRILGGITEGTLDHLEGRILDGLAPQAEKQAHLETARFLADLERLWSAPPGQEDAPANFDALFKEACRKEFGHADAAVLADCRNTIRHLFYFHGGDVVLKNIEKRLNALPTPTRVNAYVMAIRFLDSLKQLRQWQN